MPAVVVEAGLQLDVRHSPSHASEPDTARPNVLSKVRELTTAEVVNSLTSSRLVRNVSPLPLTPPLLFSASADVAEHDAPRHVTWPEDAGPHRHGTLSRVDPLSFVGAAIFLIILVVGTVATLRRLARYYRTPADIGSPSTRRRDRIGETAR